MHVHVCLVPAVVLCAQFVLAESLVRHSRDLVGNWDIIPNIKINERQLIAGS